jgi:hypothetical protein
MTLIGDRLWLPGDIKAVAGAARDARFSIEKRVTDGQVAVGTNASGWGQYLDEVHSSPSQWGLLGTSAGYQVLARVQAEGTPVPELHRVRPLLPQDIGDIAILHPAVQEKANGPKNDLQNIIRLAFIAEALAADKPGTIIPAPHPPLVAYIFSLARHQQSWNPRSAQPEGKDAPGHPTTTAYVLHALRRYEDSPNRFRPVRTWLARQYLSDATLRARPDYVALIGLALTASAWDKDNPEDVRTAINGCQTQLIEWRKRERTLVINRPLFEGYQLGRSTDYLIFNPELMAALFFLRNANPRPARRFVALVTRELTQNVQANRGFEGQLGMVPTVDQEWAARLLHLFGEIYDDRTRRHLLLPGPLTSTRARWGFFAGSVLLLAGLLIAIGVDVRTGVITFVFGAIVNAIILVMQRHTDD